MDPITKRDNSNIPLNNPIGQAGNVKRKVTKSLIDNVYVICAIMLIILPIIVFLTDIKLTDLRALTDIGLGLIILWFCSFAMYVNCSEAGVKAGMCENVYAAAIEEYDKLKKDLKLSDNINRLPEFCEWYKRKELDSARTDILSEVGISYKTYLKEYIGKSKEELKTLNLSKPKLKAIITANSYKYIDLNPDKILKRGRGGRGRTNPLATAPETRRNRHNITKLITSFFSAGLTCFVAIEAVMDPSLATLAIVCLKVLLIGINAVRGYSMGYNNIVIDTVNYVSDQSDLIVQCNKYITAYPIPQTFDDNEKEETTATVPESDTEETTQDEEIIS